MHSGSTPEREWLADTALSLEAKLSGDGSNLVSEDREKLE